MLTRMSTAGASLPELLDALERATSHWDRILVARELEAYTSALGERLAAHDHDAIDAALAYLDADLYYFRSGYAKQKLLRRLAHQPFDAAQRARVRVLVLQIVDGERHGPMRELKRVARTVADNPMRRALRRRLHSTEEAQASRALQVLLQVKRPGFTTDDIDRVHRIIESRAARYSYWANDLRASAVAQRFWTSEWHDELLAASRQERQLGARRILDAARRTGWAGT